MELIILLVPFLASIILLLFFRKQTVWWEYLILILPAILFYFFLKAVIISIEESATEYLGTYSTKITHYDAWDEWIHRTCTRSVGTGKHRRTVTYDCSYRDYHPEKWEIEDREGGTFPISEAEFNKIKKMWNTPEKFRDMHRHYFTIDGDAQYHEWNGNKATIRDLTYPHTYDNKIKISKSIFNFEDIDDDEAKQMGLLAYPEVTDSFYQCPFINYRGKDSKGRREFEYLNGMYGKKYQFRCFVLFFYNKDITISVKQRDYWVGGNKNEFIVCIGMDSVTNKMQWVNCFSWCDNPSLEVHTEQYLNSCKNLNLTELGQFIEKRVPTEWKRKEFSDFNYIKTELTTTQYIVILIFMVIYSIGMSMLIVVNEYRNKE